jgi:hypothetical protein
MADHSRDSDWTKLPIDLIAREADLRHTAMIADSDLQFADYVGDKFSAAAECDAQAAKCGLLAWNLAADFRKRHGLPAFGIPETATEVAETLTSKAAANERKGVLT